MILKEKNGLGKSTKKSWKPTMQNVIPRMKVIQKTYAFLRKKNLNNRQYIDAYKVANVRRQIPRGKRLADTEILQIEETDKDMTPERNVELVLIMENLDNEEIEKTINKIRKGEKIIQQEEQRDKVEQERYELEPETKEMKEKTLRKIQQIKHIKLRKKKNFVKSDHTKR